MLATRLLIRALLCTGWMGNVVVMAFAPRYTTLNKIATAKSTSTTTTALSAIAPGRNSLKPAAAPLMDAGKAMAYSGELLIDVTTALDLYGGALSAAGAEIRNAGDAVAQAAASMRFKTGMELVTDELREAGTCFQEAAQKCTLAIAEAEEDELSDMAVLLGRCWHASVMKSTWPRSCCCY